MKVLLQKNKRDQSKIVYKKVFKKLKRKYQNAKELEIQLKHIINSKNDEIFRCDQWLTEETEKRWGLSRKLLQQEPQINSLSKENLSLKNELADCQNKWDKAEKKLAKKREKLEIERRAHLDAVDATARWYKKFWENEKNKRLLAEKEGDRLKNEVANLKAKLAEFQREKLKAQIQLPPN